MSRLRVWFWWMVGFVGLGLAIFGTVTPIVPTVPFLIMAVYGFNRSSPRFHGMIMNHPVFGPQIRDWQEHRAIDRRVKVIVLVSMAVGLVISYLFILPLMWWLVQLVVLGAVAAYIVTRKSPPRA